MTAAQGSVSKSVTAATQERQKIDPATGQPMVDADGNPVMEAYTAVSDLDAATGSSVDVTGAPTRTLQTGLTERETAEKQSATSAKADIEDKLKNFDQFYQNIADNHQRSVDQLPSQLAMLKERVEQGDKDPNLLMNIRMLEEQIKNPPAAPTKEQVRSSLQSSLTQIDSRLNELNKQTGASELVEGTGVDQKRIDEELKKSEAASVKDELDTLLDEFEDGNTPAWAKGAMRRAQQELAARGISSSSMAGEAIVQAMIEASLPIASIDASNKQAMALEKARQRATFLGQEFDQAYETKVTNAAKVSEIANLNFTAQQTIALENSRAANTMALENLSNEQALVMAEAAQISQLETTNLNNRQKARVENAKNFLQMDMANLEAEQQTTLLKQQSVINAITSDTAADNAAKQFNAANQQQNDQFFANLGASVGQFNAAQLNAVKQFNADSVNSVLEFNSKIQNQRELFNAQNALVVAQANAQWRQNTQTLNTAAANESNMEYTRLLNGLTMTTLDEILQRERDTLSMAFQISENSANRANAIILEKLAADATIDAAKLQAELDASAQAGDFMKEVFLKIIGL